MAVAGPPGRRESGRGFTIVEVMVALSIFAVVLAAAFLLLNVAQRDAVRQRDANRALETLRTAEASIGVVLRSAGADPFETGAALLDPDPLGHGRFDNLRVVSDFNPPDGDFGDLLEDVLFHVNGDTLYVRWQAGAEPAPLAYPIEELAFSYLDADGASLPYGVAPAGAVAVRVSLAAGKGTRSDSLHRRETWTFLRNR